MSLYRALELIFQRVSVAVSVGVQILNKGPFQRYGSHFEFYCFKQLLWDAQWERHSNLPPKHPIIAIRNIGMQGVHNASPH